MDRHDGWAVVAAAALFLAALSGCQREVHPRDAEGRAVLRLAYLPNVTHAPALWGLESGHFARALAPDAVLAPRAFNAGPSIVEALYAGEIDLAYIGPGPTITAYQRSGGKAIELLSAATYGGAELVVSADIQKPADLVGRKVATPQLGNTQDIALRSWLAGQGLAGVEVVPTPPAGVAALFARGSIAGAWLPQPWSSRLVLDQGARVLVDERDLWPERKLLTTVLIASAKARRLIPGLVDRFARAHEEALVATASPEAREVVARALAREMGKPVAPALLERAFGQLTFSAAVDPAILEKLAGDAHRLGFLPSKDVSGLAPRGAR